MTALRQVLVATDFSPSAEAALGYGRALARRLNASLHVLHVCPLATLRRPAGEAADLLNAARRAVVSWRNDPVAETARTHAIVKVADDAAKAIVAYARAARIDVIVLGARGAHPVRDRVVGGVAEHVVGTAPCAVICVSETAAQPERRAGVRAA